MSDKAVKKKQMKLYVTFRENEEEKDLHDWCVEEGKVGGTSNFFKRLALEEKRRREGK